MAKWGLILAEIRRSKGLTQQDLADRSGLKLSHISRIEMGDIQTYKEGTLNRLARALDMTPIQLSNQFLGGEGPADKIPTHELIAELKERYEVGEMVEMPIRGYIFAGTPAPAEAVDLGKGYAERNQLSGVKNVSALYMLRVCGESLIGDGIRNSDNVVIEPTTDLVEGKIYVVKLDNEFVARHVHLKNGTAILTSSNGTYKEIAVNKLEIVGRVVLAYNPDWRKF